MGERQTVGLDGSRCGLLVPLVLLALSLAPITRTSAQATSTTCSPAIGRIVSLQGNVEVQRTGQKEWVAVTRLDTVLCAEDRLRTDAQSRAGIFLQPETMVRVDQNTVIRLKQSNDEIEVQFFGVEVVENLRNAQPSGGGYFITRFPKKFKVTTPHMNAAVEGTEFMVQITPAATKLTVLEGKVSSQSVATGNTQLVAAGQSVSSGATGPSTIETVVKPQDAVQWVLRYPPISDQSDTSGISRAEKLLRAGSVEEALAAIDAELAANPSSSDAYALRSVIQVAKNDKVGALDSARKSTEFGAENYRAWLALSYAQQAGFALEAALESARKGESLRGESALAHARVAELLLSLGESRPAEEAARAAVAANMAESYAHSMLGFVHIAQIDIAAARVDFTAAIERDSFSALPRLGLGLAMIRDGELVDGRKQIEIAVALDPSNALIRSYVGKAYYEENKRQRDDLAETQFELAKKLDGSDPTPHFYEAMLRQAENQPVTAIDELHRSIEKNDNRAVYRSRFQLDDDAAARTASLAALYVELGFEQQAILESSSALATNPGNYSAHNLLATAYASLPRHDIARVSEVLQGQIRQPVSHSSTMPLLGADNLAILRASGPSQLGTSEFNELFNRDGVRFDFDVLGGSKNTFADQFQASALAGSLSATVSQLHYETDGFVENDAAEKNLYDLLLQKQFAWNSSVQLDVKRTEFSVEESFFAFDPDNQLPVTIGEVGNLFRTSGHYGAGADSDWIWTAAYEVRDRDVTFFPGGFVIAEDDADAYAGEIQHWKAWDAIQITSGGGYIDSKTSSPLEGVTVQARAANAYMYGNWTSPTALIRVDAGLSADWYRREHSDIMNAVSREQLSPKLAVTWTVRTGSTLRLAAFSAVRRPFAGSQTIEPTQIAGFNQYFSGLEGFYGDVEGTVSRRVALAFDQSFSQGMNAGIEIAKRELDVPSNNLDRDFLWRESTGHAYLYKTFSLSTGGDAISSWTGVATIEGEYERIERPQLLTGSEGIIDLETTRLPIGLRFFQMNGLTFRIQGTYIRQVGTFSQDIDSPIIDRDDRGWVTDVAIDYQIPRRRGVVTVGVMNASDESISLVETDLFNPRVANARFAFAKVRLTF